MNSADEEKDKAKDKAKEPEVGYDNRVIITSHADLEERDREFTRKMTHEERMFYLQKLISITFGNDLSVYEKILFLKY